MSLPPPVITEHDGVLVVRDDLIDGGTKRRALPALMAGSAREFVYSSPVYGYAQIALAHTARELGSIATIFCAKRKTRHARTAEAEAAGARIVEVPCGYMSVVSCRAREYAELFGAELLPFGLDTPVFLSAMAKVAVALPVAPKEVWTVAGSGCLTRALQIAWPGARFYAVRVGAEPSAGTAQVLCAPEKYERDAQQPPPFPSCINYDAKAWRFIKQHAKPGALFWNVAR